MEDEFEERGNPTFCLPKGCWFLVTPALLVVVDRLSKAVILAPCNKTITAEETLQLYINHVWKRTGLPKKVISDRGPQFASKVMCEIWEKLGVKSSLSTVFHP